MVFNVKESKERLTLEPSDLPYEVIRVDNIPIKMSDGAYLYAYLWIPKLVYEGKASLKLGTLVEYLPYRKSDFTSIRDSIRHPYYAGYGFASIRVDMRGCGDSDGVILGEYLEQEQQDNYRVFDWICQQPWSNGRIGQFGKSWGGFNSLQIAAKQHPSLKTIITLMSTDDRYADDVHYRGGCLMASDMLWWASTMFAYNARPQDPTVRPNWQENWLKRLELEPNVIEWMSHQTRDSFWKHGSICEDYSKVDIPVLAVGGWRDGYTNAVLRMMQNLPNSECRSIIGPWVHEYPEVAGPAPSIGYNQLAVQWFSKYLNTEPEILSFTKTLNTNEFDISQLRRFNAYIQEPTTIDESYKFRPGRWISCDKLGPSKEVYSKSGTLDFGSSGKGLFSFSGSQEYGLFRGTWCPFGQSGDFPPDQKIEDSKSFTIDSSPLEESVALFGHPILNFDVQSDVEVANMSVRLIDLDTETGENVLVSWGQLNLNKFVGSYETPENLVPNKRYAIKMSLDAVGCTLKKGHKLRLAFSTTDWPSFWPLPKTPTLTIDNETFKLKLPLLDAPNLIKFPTAESLAPYKIKILREEKRAREIVNDVVNNAWEIRDFSDEGERKANGVTMGSWNRNLWQIKEGDPLSARNECEWELILDRDDTDWGIKLRTTSVMTCTASHFELYNQILGFQDGQPVFEKKWHNNIPRNFA